MLKAIAEILAGKGLIGSEWAAKREARGQLVRLFREYYEGQHRLKLTDEMRKMMQIGDTRLDRYNDNYCEMVVDKLGDRLVLDTVENSAADAQTWAETLMTANRMDALQIAVHEAELRDGEAFVMTEYQDGRGTILALELAWDGATGILPVYDGRGEKLVAAAKVWLDGNVTRVNIYYQKFVERYTADGSELKVFAPPEDTTRLGNAPGVPLVAFRNRGEGKSELVNVIPLQDSLNRTLISMVMNGELTAFSLLFAVGFKPPSGVTPGMVIHAMIEGDDGNPIISGDKDEAEAYAALMAAYKLERIPGGSVAELIGQAEFLIDQISTISSTPIPSRRGSGNISGEALKQLDISLLGKARRAQVQIGNAWEDVFALAHRIESLYATDLPPTAGDWYARWKTAQIRNDADIRDTAKLLHDWGYEREALRVLSQSSQVQYSEKDIDALIAEKAADSGAILQQAAGSLPGFANFAAAG